MKRSNISDTTKKGGSLDKYQDTEAITQVLGCLIKSPQLLKTYQLRLEDFVKPFHRVLFSVINHMARNNATDIQPSAVMSYLKENYPAKYEMFNNHNGVKYMEAASDYSLLDNFEMYYNTVRKWSLLRELKNAQIDVSEYYDPDEVVVDAESEKKRDKFEGDSLEDILTFYKSKLVRIASEFNQDGSQDQRKAGGTELLEQIDAWKKAPDFGLSYSSQLLTTVTYGLRRKRFTVVSAPSGTGKTRMTIANMCFSYAPYYWDSNKGAWEPNPHGTENSALYIGTEMELLSEIEPIILAYMADVPEDHITQNLYEPGEEKRVREAADYLRQKDEDGNEKNCGIFLEYLPQFDADTLENIIEKYVTMHGISAVFFDYIYSNPKLLAEYSNSSGGSFALRDDQALGHLSTRLKEMTRKYNISIDTCTQVSGDYKNTDNYDETIVRGAKAIIDKCDIGMILTHPNEKEKLQLEPIKRRVESINKPEPNACLTVYKNRGGRYSKVKIWLFVDYRTMRVHDLFATNKEYELLKIDKSRVIVDEGGMPHIFTNTDAMDQFKQGLISKNMYDKVRKQEKQDPSYRQKTAEDEQALKQAEKEAADNNVDIDDDLFDY